jgi:hypothetical protein
MTRRRQRPAPPRSATRQPLPARSRHTTVSAQPLPDRAKSRDLLPRGAALPKRQVARIVDEQESSLLDLIDNLIGKGVMLNADLILALANVDLVYVRLSALLCAADRVLPRAASKRTRA